ncbi:Myb/SANT-like DNA-binding domain 4 [Dillenia turbinata]|uniref:Myb/SANT-like DNA-binding domain 4 n=1 Tax=Dillenia turbinata TaxID=194707 RepID=A0AAN8YZP5_9MAGN
MFDGVPPEQLFHQFIASRTTSLPLPLNFSLHGSSPQPQPPPPQPPPPPPPTTATTIFQGFDPFSSSHQTLQPISFSLHQLHQHTTPTLKDHEDKGIKSNNFVSTNLELDRERSIQGNIDPWSSDEALALLRIRSSMENWYPDFTWEHVSRKLAEMGFKRSAEKCKEKFEEESRCLNSINYNKNYRFFSELEELYQSENPQILQPQNEKNRNWERLPNEDHQVDQQEGKAMDQEQSAEDASRNEKPSGVEDKEMVVVASAVDKSKEKKRKREEKFEMLKGFCQDIVKKMINQQEELHNKLIEDMLKRDEEKLAREEAWKKHEMDRINKELEIRAHEQAIAGDRQATIIELLKKFTSSSSSLSTSDEKQNLLGVMHKSDQNLLLNNLPTNNSTSSSSTSLVPAQNPTPIVPQEKTQDKIIAPSSSTILLPHKAQTSLPSETTSISQNPRSTISTQNPKTPQNPNCAKSNIEGEDHGRRWPREEVLSLINLRCSLYNNNSGGGGSQEENSKEGTPTTKAPLWERISQGMLELGYKRSAKRCKEKWENINKYFRKTKDVNKKRSLDSRTCPYFYQLSNLYNQGTLNIAHCSRSEGQANNNICSTSSPENHKNSQPEISLKSSQNGSTSADVHAC